MLYDNYLKHLKLLNTGNKTNFNIWVGAYRIKLVILSETKISI